MVLISNNEITELVLVGLVGRLAVSRKPTFGRFSSRQGLMQQ